MITQEQIDKAAAEVEAAEVALDAAEDAHARVGSKAAGAELQRARGRSHNARDGLRRMTTQFATEQAGRRARGVAEAAFAAEAPAVASRLDECRGVAVRALADAQDAVERLLAVVSEYDATVRATAEDLRRRGLTADGDEQLGGVRTGRARIDGREWVPVDPASVLGELVHRVMRTRDPRNPLATLTAHGVGGMAAAASRHELFDAAGAGVR